MDKKVIKIERKSWDGKLYEQALTFLKTDFYCPGCGEQAIWHQPNSEIDYGGGDRHVCSSCGSQFYSWWDGKNEKIADELC